MTDAWDGRPENPERDGAHVLRDKRTGKVRAMQWEGQGGEWWGFTARRAAYDYDYLGPALLPSDLAARDAETREKALREAAAIAAEYARLSTTQVPAAILALIPQQQQEDRTDG